MADLFGADMTYTMAWKVVRERVLVPSEDEE
jgi:hypothetical protein